MARRRWLVAFLGLSACSHTYTDSEGRTVTCEKDRCVRVHFCVDPHGKVYDTMVVRRHSDRKINRTCWDTVDAWEFEPPPDGLSRCTVVTFDIRLEKDGAVTTVN